jgi:predicted cobalt transporter CbtA
MHAATHAAGVHPTTHPHPAAVHATTHTHAPAHAAAVSAATTAAAASERRWRKGNAGRERTRNEATQDLAAHRNLSFMLEPSRRISPPHEANDPEIIQ